MVRIYETERLLLRKLGPEDSPKVLTFYEDNKSLFEPLEPKRGNNFYTIAYQKASLTAEQNQMAEGKLIRYWVFLKDNPEEILGTVCFQNLQREPYHSCCIGYKFSHRYHHQGYAFESIKRSIELVFWEERFHRIDAYIMQSNEPSLRLIERLSFQYEGTSVSFARVNGNWADHRHYALLNPNDCLYLL
jgi:ribosomal-protein-alanine N-acetyltransferase